MTQAKAAPLASDKTPCPFCDSADLEKCTDDGVAFTRCRNCGATGPCTTRYSGEEGEEFFDWNTRAHIAALEQCSDDWRKAYEQLKIEHHNCVNFWTEQAKQNKRQVELIGELESREKRLRDCAIAYKLAVIEVYVNNSGAEILTAAQTNLETTLAQTGGE